MPRPDDDALTWDGDDDPTLDVAAPTNPSSLPEGWSAVGKGSEAVVTSGDATVPRAHPDAAAPASATPPAPGDEATPLGNAALVSLGVLGGAYLLYAIGWLIGGLRLEGGADFLVDDVVYRVSLWMAVLAPLLWFGTVWLVTRWAATWVRFAWLAAGIVLLVPWPFIMVGVVGR